MRPWVLDGRLFVFSSEGLQTPSRGCCVAWCVRLATVVVLVAQVRASCWRVVAKEGDGG